MTDLQDFLKEMGLDKAKPVKAKPAQRLPDVFNDPRDTITGEVPF
jgi:hypothetical protein